MSIVIEPARVNVDFLAGPALSPEQQQHEKQIVQRAKKLEAAMSHRAAISFTDGTMSAGFGREDPLVPLGTTTIFSLRRFWRDNGSLVILLAGFKARLEEGKIRVGGPEGNVCAYDLRLRTFPTAAEGSKICSSWKTTTLRAGLKMDLDTETAVRANSAVQQEMCLPRFWAAFRPGEVPEAEDCPAAWRLARNNLRDGVTLPCMRANGRKIVRIDRDVPHDGKLMTYIGWDGNEDHPEEVTIVPNCAVLHLHTRPGMGTEAGTSLGYFGPKRAYTNIALALGEDTAQWLLEESVQATDIVHDGMTLRKVELCPSSLGSAAKIYEDLYGLVDQEKFEGITQILNDRDKGRNNDRDKGRNNDRDRGRKNDRDHSHLEISRADGLITANLWEVKPHWERKFQ